MPKRGSGFFYAEAWSLEQYLMSTLIITKVLAHIMLISN